MALRKRHKQTVPSRASVSAFGVPLELEAGSPELMEELRACLPPGWVDSEASSTLGRLTLSKSEDGSYRLQRDDRTLLVGDLDEAVEEAERTMRMHFAHNAPAHFFLHAGAVTYNGAGIVVPGASFSGKTSLVSALVRAGAIYYSDENAVFDEDGLLHPYPKPLGLRLTDGLIEQTPHQIELLGGVAGSHPVRLELVVVAEYQPGSRWQPDPMSAAETVQALMQHTFLGLERPRESLAALHRAAVGATGLKGVRGEADETAAMLLDLVMQKA